MGEFQSTHPVRGGTHKRNTFAKVPAISIHPPREGWDTLTLSAAAQLQAFQSTHPVRGGTIRQFKRRFDHPISIHPPREGWDAAGGCGYTVGGISIHPPREGWDRFDS